MDAKSEVRKRGLVWFLPALLVLVFGFLFGSLDAFADSSGGYLGPGVIDEGSGGDGGCSGNNCDNWSWIFYKTTEDAYKKYKDLPEELYFVPNLNIDGDIYGKYLNLKISRECVEHYHENSGVWAVGINGLGQLSTDYYGRSVFNNQVVNSRLGFTDADGGNQYPGDKGYYFKYTTTDGGYGHRYTNSQSRMESQSGWIGVEGGFRGRAFNNSELSHSIYAVKGSTSIELFRATKYGWSDDVYKDFKIACEAAEESNCSEAAFKGYFGFCYWPEMGNRLTAYAVSEDGKTLFNGGNPIGGTPKKLEKNKEVTVTANKEYDNNGKYTLIGWKAPTNPSANGCQSLGADILSGSSNGTQITINGNIYRERMSNPISHTICAVYKKEEEKKYTLEAIPINESGLEIADPVQSKPVSAGNTATVSAPSVAQWKFTGNWRETQYGSTSHTGPSYSTKLSQNKTVYAVYEQDEPNPSGGCWDSTTTQSVEYVSGDGPKKYERNWKNVLDGNGNPTGKQTCAKNCYYYEYRADNKTGFTFLGWSSSSDGSHASGTQEDQWFSSYMYAVYERIKFNFSVKFHGVDDGINRDIATTKLYKEGVTYTPPDIPGYTLVKSNRENKINECIQESIGLELTYEKNVIEGKSDVGTKTTDWTQGGKDMRKDAFVIENCSPTNGCEVTFKHWLRRKSGSGTSKYEIKRMSNLTSRVKNINSIAGELSFGLSDNKEKEVRTETVKLYPGMVVCETMTFDNWPGKNSKGINIVCAHAAGNSQCEKGSADCPNNCEDEETSLCEGGNSLLRIGVKNENVEQYQKYQKEVYAKPGDKIKFKATYFPQLQYACHLAPQAMQIDGSLVISGNTRSFTQTIFNNNRQPAWNNAFAVRWDDPTSGYTYRASNPFKADCGKTDTRRATSNGYEVQANKDVGTKIEGVAKTNEVDASKTTPSQIKFSSNGSENVGNVITSQIESEAVVKVPYNFTTVTKLLNKPGEGGDPGTVDAGETLTVYYEVYLDTKVNELTDGTYVTKAPGAKRFIRAYWVENGIRSDEQKGTEWDIRDFDNVPYTDRRTESLKYNEVINVPDIAAGSKFCITSVVTPGNSGADDNISVGGFIGESVSGKWDDVCYIVAKKPNFQVWGGELFVNGNAEAFVSKKKYLKTWGYRVR